MPWYSEKIDPANELNVVFVIDKILDSRLTDDQYDYFFDRGCLHIFQSVDRPPQHIILYALYTQCMI